MSFNHNKTIIVSMAVFDVLKYGQRMIVHIAHRQPKLIKTLHSLFCSDFSAIDLAIDLKMQPNKYVIAVLHFTTHTIHNTTTNKTHECSVICTDDG